MRLLLPSEGAAVIVELQALSGQRFGAITLCTVFEHLVDHDRWLQDAHEVLEAGGLLVSLNPTAGFARLAATLLRLGRLQAGGWTICKRKTGPGTPILPWILQEILN